MLNKDWNMTAKPRKLPFTVNRDDARSLLDQVTDGLREAIVGGYYAPGDVLPSSHELVPLLGVSRIVTKNALARLAAEGYIASHVGTRSTVRDTGAKRWRGHVVFVCPEKDFGFFQTVFGESLRTGLNRAGYLFTRATVESGGGQCDFPLLDAALARSADLVAVLYEHPAIFRHLTALKVPFVAVAQCAATPRGAAGFTRLDYELAVPDFAKACKAAGVARVVDFRWDHLLCDAAPLLRASGLDARRTLLRPDLSHGQLIGVERAGRAAMERLIAGGRLPHDAVLFFADDYLARGALAALSYAGLKTPEDIRVATWANAGLGPDYPRELSRMEIDPVRAGGAVAAAVLEYLETGVYPEGIVIGPRWIGGETMR